MSDRLLRRHLAAEYLQRRYGIGTYHSLRQAAFDGSGPVFRKIGNFPVYTEADLDAWALSKMSEPVTANRDLRLSS